MPYPTRPLVAGYLFVAIFLEGLMLSIPGPTLGALAENAGASLSQIGTIFTAMGLGFVAGALLAGRIFATLPGSQSLGLSLLLMGATAVVIPSISSLAGLMTLFVLAGVAVGVVDVGSNSVLVWEFGPRVPPYMNALHLFWGLGALTAPLLVAWLAKAGGGVLMSYRVFGLAMVVMGILIVMAPVTQIPTEPTQEPSPRPRHSSFVLLMAVLFFLHVGAELAFGGWIFSYARLSDVGTEVTASILNSVFWGGLVVGRVIAIPLSLRVSPTTLIWLDLTAAGTALAVVAWPGSASPAIWAGTAMFGISIASLFASCMNFAQRRVPISSRVTSAFVVGAGLGSMSIPWLTGAFLDRIGPRGLHFVVGGAIVGALFVFAMLSRFSSHA